MKRCLPLFLLFLVATAFSIPAVADTNQFAGETFGQQVLEHESDITPFLKEHQENIYRTCGPGFQYIVATILALNLIVGWFCDFVAAYILSRVFAPTYALLKQAFIFTTGHLILIIFFSIFSMFLFSTIGAAMPWYMFEILIVLLLLIVSVIQTILVSFCYRTAPDVSVKFYAWVFVLHVMALALFYPITKARATTMMSSLANKVATPTLEGYVDERMKLLTIASDARDKVKGDISDAQSQFDEANTEQSQLRKQIADMKASELFVFRRIVHLHAEGDLTSARDQLNAFLVSFPAGKMIESAKAQLTQISGELAALDAQKKQAEAAAAQAAAQARADFLARAGRGEVSLSEMHKALQGKTFAEVKELFGLPAVVEAGCWGYKQQMVFNPLTNEKHGLTIYFVQGIVQSVDYFYGTGP